MKEKFLSDLRKARESYKGQPDEMAKVLVTVLMLGSVIVPPASNSWQSGLVFRHFFIPLTLAKFDQTKMAKQRRLIVY